MKDHSKANQDKNPQQPQPKRPQNFEQIDPHRKDQHSPAGNSPDREDENLKGAQKHHDPIPNVEMTKPTGFTPQRGQPGESAAGGFEEGPVNSRTPSDDHKKR